MTKEIKELERIRSILSYVTGFEDDDQENIEDARKSVDRVIDSLADQPAQRKPLTDEQIKEAVRGAGLSFTAPDFKVARAVEAAHNITQPSS